MDRSEASVERALAALTALNPDGAISSRLR
jgi:hypothetical protein